MNCQYCGSPIPHNTASCPACGARCEVQPNPAAPSAPAAAPVQDGLVDLLIVKFSGGNTIAAIKELRAVTGWGLKEAKAAVEGGLTPIAFSISPAEAAVLQNRLTAVGLSLTTQAANPALKDAGLAKNSSLQKSGCLIMLAPFVAAAIWFLI